ncbi:EAL domain-containing protein [Magnetospirillum sp. UT-4]|uniref:sensor domain-containing protein n=1 Tax=Magnetospirillum sp. UT-4 TaxID=2681467 RepID=UPI00137EB63F|nr:EAL domain-containing protein [Magnetospirillum sp. UT-4]CAA7620516.1 PAS domain S-box/diguanylate cyclase (GGDEF) domain-containing protein [Magnetospirillum sp. UT-4]
MAFEDHSHILDLAPVLIWRANTSGACDWFNRAWLDFTGRPLQDELGEGWFEGVHGDDATYVLETYRDAFDRRLPFSMQYRLRHRDGGFRPIVDNGFPLVGSDGRFSGYVGYCFDISDLASAREEADEGRRRFEDMFEQSPDPTLIVDDGRFTACNAAALRQLGCSAKEQVLGRHPWDLSPGRQPGGELSSLLAERMMATAQDAGVLRFEWVHQRADGSTFPAEITLSPILMQGRRVLYCTWRDISERKRIEAEMRLAANVVRNTSEGVVVTNGDGIILSVNPAFTDITGYLESEAIGQTPRILRSDLHEDGFYADMWKCLKEAGEWQGEVWNRRKSGEVYAQWLTISPIPGANGRPEQFVGLFSDLTELRRKDEQIRHYAYHDPLTGLPNRLLLQDRLSHAIEVAKRERTRLAVLFIDLDRFKIVNDSLGHDAGDTLLVEITGRLKDGLRRSDTIARLGGDEFVVILTGFTNAAEIADIAAKIISSVERPVAVKGHSVNVGASIGISLYPQDGEDGAILMRSADTAMYGAKNAGRSTFSFFDASMNGAALERLELEEALRRAIERGEFALHYQPKINLDAGLAVGAEALIRWHTPDGRTVPPTQFIPIAEETGLIEHIGEWVIEEAVRQIADWRRRGLGELKVAVNVSARQFHNGLLPDRISAVLDKHGVPPSALEVELTESTVMADPDSTIRQMGRLRTIGIEVSIDDFGVGYSNLSNLKILPLGTVKIDRSFVTGVATHPHNAAIVEAIIGLAGALGMKVVAEGVESDADEAHLVARKCHIAQGFKYAQPLPADQFEAWLAGVAV